MRARLAQAWEYRTMDPTLFQFYVAIFMVAVIGALFIWFLQSEADASTRRITGMMMRAGFNPGVATLGHRRAGVVPKLARRRCGKCPREDYCDRWLAGDVESDNKFCPNAGVFRALDGAGRGTA